MDLCQVPCWSSNHCFGILYASQANVCRVSSKPEPSCSGQKRRSQLAYTSFEWQAGKHPHTWHASSVTLHGKVRGYAVCWDRPSVKRALLLKQQTRPHGTVWCAANFPVTGNERPAVPAKACLGINGQGRGAGEGQTLCGPVSVSLGDSSRTKRRQRFRSNDVCDAIACPYRGQPIIGSGLLQKAEYRCDTYAVRAWQCHH